MMGRHNLNKYKPEGDSSKTKKAQDLAKKDGVLVIEQKTQEVDVGQGENKKQETQYSCPCGCMEFTANRKTTFRMGHDARFRGALLRAHQTGTKVVRIVDGKPGKAETAEAVAKQYGESFTKAIAAADQRLADANKKALEKALNSTRLIEVGKSKYTGQVVAVYEGNGKPNSFDIEYVTKGGATKTLKGVPESDAPKATAKQIKDLAPDSDDGAKETGQEEGAAAPAAAA